jgi:hypothetical protein
MTGRELHDALLRVLTDGDLRGRLLAGDPTVVDPLGDEATAILRRADRERLTRLARFMGRHFYRERIVRLFRYSRALALARGRDPLVVLDSPSFSAALDSAVLGSRETADAVARLVEARLLPDLSDCPFGRDLAGYEGAMFRVEAGPRRWHGSPADRDGLPRRSPNARLIEMEWNLIPLMAALRSGAPSPPEPPREPTRLLIALSPEGRVSTVRCPDPVKRLLDALDGRRTPAEIASTAGMSEADARRLLEQLAGIGALDWQPSPGAGA